MASFGITRQHQMRGVASAHAPRPGQQCPTHAAQSQPIIRNYSRKFFRVIFMGKGLKCLQRPAFTAFFSGLLHNRVIHLSFTIIKLK